jgi:DNA (cytosine-5)-methyltransferase 1
MQKDRFTVISTFSGCGGSSLGYQKAGGKVCLAVEWDDHAVNCYKQNFPNTTVYHGDISALTTETIYKMTGLSAKELDILDGSPPCQGFSTSGKRKSGDNRNSLFKEYCRLLSELQPKCFVMENVSGLIKGHMKIVAAEIFRTLKACGYSVKAKLLNTKNFGVPQSRERVIFIGVRKDFCFEPVFPQPFTHVIPFGQAVQGCAPEEKQFLKNKSLLLWKHTTKGKNFADANEKFFGKPSFFNSVRLSENKVAPTLSKMVGLSRASFCHLSEPRLLTISEAKRCHSFPDDFILTGSFAEQWARIGNSVPPKFMQAIAESLHKNVLSKL